MGARQSAESRSVSVSNPNPNLLELSDEVVLRLKKGISQQAKENAAATETKVLPTITNTSELQATPVIHPQPVLIAAGGKTVTAADMQRKQETDLQKNDLMWRKRMLHLEQTLKKTNEIMEKEYTNAVEGVRKRFVAPSQVNQLPPCQDIKKQLISCYRANPGETLKCSEDVALFNNCVSMNRMQKVDEKARCMQTPCELSSKSEKKENPAKAA